MIAMGNRKGIIGLLLLCLAAVLPLIVPANAYTYRFNPDASLYDASDAYLSFLQLYIHQTMTGIRVSMGVYEIKASLSRWVCDGLCIFGGPGHSMSPNAGLTSLIEVGNIFLNSATISLLSALFMQFTLRYITSGLLLLFLPFGLILRSLSFTRPLGSSLIALVISLYIFYPLMLVMNSMIFPFVAGEVPDLAGFSGESGLGGNIVGSAGNGPNMTWMVQKTAASFFGAIFLPAINFIIIVALARQTAHILGEELDISRLSQMV